MNKIIIMFKEMFNLALKFRYHFGISVNFINLRSKINILLSINKKTKSFIILGNFKIFIMKVIISGRTENVNVICELLFFLSFIAIPQYIEAKKEIISDK